MDLTINLIINGMEKGAITLWKVLTPNNTFLGITFSDIHFRKVVELTWVIRQKKKKNGENMDLSLSFYIARPTFQFTSVQSLSRVQLFATPWTAALQASLSITNSWSLTNSCPLSQRCHPTISSSVVPFSSHLQSFPASGSFQMSQFFTSGGQSIGVSALTSILPMNIQNWFILGWSGWISLQSKGLSRVFSNTTVQKHQFFSAQLSL